tara:strand:+ start:997 stop:1224 length:228 start_codon:yes stop_codon:yes gene_type:complete
MSKRDVNKAVEDFISGGGKVTKLRYASDKDVRKSSRLVHHKDRVIMGSEASKKYVENKEKKEASLIFSREERWAE